MKLLELRKTSDFFVPAVVMSTDSAIITRGMPVFLPEISESWDCEISVAYRISRLGKSISPKFAHRYYDAMTLIARMIPRDFCTDLNAAGQGASPLAFAFDGAVSLGQWIPAEHVSSVSVHSPVNCRSDDYTSTIEQAIGFLSRTFTIKTGDIIVDSSPLITLSISIGNHIEAALNDKTLLSFNIK